MAAEGLGQSSFERSRDPAAAARDAGVGRGDSGFERDIAQAIRAGATLDDLRGIAGVDRAPQSAERTKVTPSELSDPLVALIMGTLSPLDQVALPITNAVVGRILGVRQEPAVEEGRIGFQTTADLSSTLAGLLLQSAGGPLVGPALKKLAGVSPEFRIGFNTLEDIERLNAAREPVRPGDVEGGLQALAGLTEQAPALAGQFGAGGGLPQLPGGALFGGPEDPASDLGLGGDALTQAGLGGTTRALQELQRQRLVRTLIERLDDQSIEREA